MTAGPPHGCAAALAAPLGAGAACPAFRRAAGRKSPPGAGAAHGERPPCVAGAVRQAPRGMDAKSPARKRSRSSPRRRAPPMAREKPPCGKLPPRKRSRSSPRRRAHPHGAEKPSCEIDRADFRAQRPARRGEEAPARSGRGTVPKRTRRPDESPAAGSLCFAKFRSGREVRTNFRNLTAEAAGRPAGPGWPEPAWPERTAPGCCSWCRPSSPRQRRCRGWWTRRPGCSRS